MEPSTVVDKLAKKRARGRAWAKAHPENYRTWRRANLDKARANSRAWNKSHPEKVRVSGKVWKKAHPEKYREQNRLAGRKRLRDHLERTRTYARNWWRGQDALKTNQSLARRLRGRIYTALKGQSKACRFLELLGCSMDGFRAHIEAQFKPGMTWDNYGPDWHIDHKRPCARFDLSKPEE